MARTLFIFALVCSSAAAGTGVPALIFANRGQAPEPVRYVAKASGITAWFLPREVRLRARGAQVRVQFLYSNAAVAVEGADPSPARVNFLMGAQPRWRSGIPAYRAVRYRDLYPGIDLLYRAEDSCLKSEFRLAPGADPALIRVRYRGAAPPAIDPDGSLAIAVGGQILTEAAPVIYQEAGGVRVPVAGRYAIAPDGAVGFALGPYDRSRALVIDPLVGYSSLVGRDNFNAATAIAVDASGAAYIAGYTDSDALATANPAQNFNTGGVAAFVAKLTPAGDSIAYCTYMGGSSDDRAYGIAVDSLGAAYVTGTTTSADFPTQHAFQSGLQGSRNAFVFKLSPMGNMLEFSTYLGGSGTETAYGIAVDSSGNSYIAGDTSSLNFPAGGYQTSNRGGQDAFVAKLSASGAQLLFASYLGGAGYDHAGAIAVDSAGTVYVTGSTWSANFPTASAFQSSLGGPCNAWVAHVDAGGSNLLFSTYLGGSGCTMTYPETGQGIAVGAQGDVYVAGVTSSADFPVRNAVQSQIQGSTDAFAARFNPAGSLLFSTFLGGTGVDVANALALDAGGAVYVAGYTYSEDFPVTASALQGGPAGGCDAFLFKLSPTGDTLLYSTYLGGAGADTISGLALDPQGNVYLSGWTLSPNFPGTRTR